MDSSAGRQCKASQDTQIALTMQQMQHSLIKMRCGRRHHGWICLHLSLLALWQCAPAVRARSAEQLTLHGL
jgi:hypothetical protein